MKKKGLIILGMLLICSVLFFLSKGLQRSAVEKLTADNRETQAVESSKPAETAENTNVSVTETENREQPPVESPKVEVKPEEVKEEKNTSVVEETKDNTENTSQSEPDPQSSTPAAPKEETNKAEGTKEPDPVDEKPNFMVLDTTTNEAIYSANIKYDNKRSVYEYTLETLTAAGIKKHIKSTGYVVMIDNRFDYPSMPDKTGKSDWTSCGWIFYINDQKATIGPKDYAPKETDIITWKYWKDAMYEK